MHNLGKIIHRFNQGCLSFQQALDAIAVGNIPEYENALNTAATQTISALELALKAHLHDVCEGQVLSKDGVAINKPTFYDLTTGMQHYADPLPESKMIKRLKTYRNLRNLAEHQATIPPFEELRNAIKDIRQVILIYLPVDKGQLKPPPSPHFTSSSVRVESQSANELILDYQTRRLQKLKEQQALRGLNTPPEILIEIEDIEAKIQELQKESTQFPSEHLVRRLGSIQQAISQLLRSTQPGQEQPYFHHVVQVISYLAHLIGLLPTDKQLSKLETFTLAAAAYLHDIGQHFPQLERTVVFKNQMSPADAHDPAQVSNLVRDYCHELSEEWIKNSPVDALYPSLGLTSSDPVSEIALVCRGHRDANLDNERYRASGSDSQRIRPALLAALLSLADMLALASVKPKVNELKQNKEPLETQVSAWLRSYLERISIQGGHIRFHYQLPPEEDSLSVRVLLSGPIQLRLREIRQIFSDNGLVIALDSSVTHGPVAKMPPNVLAHTQKLAQQRLTSVIGALGRPSKPSFVYHFTGLRKRPILRWPSLAGAGRRYQCQLFDIQQKLLAQWETNDPEISVPKDQVEPGVQYEWLTYAYEGKKQLRSWEGGIFWLVDEQTARWIDRQMTWYEELGPFERHLMQGGILAHYGLYQEASAVYQAVLEQGNEMEQLQARQELITLYENISRQLNMLGRPSRSDRYLDLALILAKELQDRID